MTTLAIMTGAACGFSAWAALLVALHFWFIGAADRRSRTRGTMWRRIDRHVYRRLSS